MSLDSQRPLMNGNAHQDERRRQAEIEVLKVLNTQLADSKAFAGFHGDTLIGD